MFLSSWNGKNKNIRPSYKYLPCQRTCQHTPLVINDWKTLLQVFLTCVSNGNDLQEDDISSNHTTIAKSFLPFHVSIIEKWRMHDDESSSQTKSWCSEIQRVWRIRNLLLWQLWKSPMTPPVSRLLLWHWIANPSFPHKQHPAKYLEFKRWRT